MPVQKITLSTSNAVASKTVFACREDTCVFEVNTGSVGALDGSRNATYSVRSTPSQVHWFAILLQVTRRQFRPCRRATHRPETSRLSPSNTASGLETLPRSMPRIGSQRYSGATISLRHRELLDGAVEAATLEQATRGLLRSRRHRGLAHLSESRSAQDRP